MATAQVDHEQACHLARATHLGHAKVGAHGDEPGEQEPNSRAPRRAAESERGERADTRRDRDERADEREVAEDLCAASQIARSVDFLPCCAALGRNAAIAGWKTASAMTVIPTSVCEDLKWPPPREAAKARAQAKPPSMASSPVSCSRRCATSHAPSAAVRTTRPLAASATPSERQAHATSMSTKCATITPGVLTRPLGIRLHCTAFELAFEIIPHDTNTNACQTCRRRKHARENKPAAAAGGAALGPTP